MMQISANLYMHCGSIFIIPTILVGIYRSLLIYLFVSIDKELDHPNKCISDPHQSILSQTFKF
jgi:hypothetical protein